MQREQEHSQTAIPSATCTSLRTRQTGPASASSIPSDPDATQDVVNDGSFTHAGATGYVNVGNGQTIGGVGGSWTVTSGDVDLEGSWADSPLGGTALGLDGTVPGAIEQTISTVAGRQYQVVFALTGNFQGGNTQDELRVSAAGISEDFSVTMPSGWSTGNLLWEHRSFTFTADDISTVLEFASLSPSGGFGPVISDVQVIEIPQAVSTILNNDSTLSYDAATGKFYRLASGISNFQGAIDAAVGDTLNGVSGQLFTIQSEYENQLIADIARSLSDDLWIGASDRTAEGDWFWLDGNSDGEQFFDEGIGTVGGNYQNWIGGNPTNTNDAARIRQELGQWETTNVTASYRYVVEWDASEVLSSFTFAFATNGDAGGRFAIDGSTGEITVAEWFVAEF